jgi:hypothetical protein
MGLICFGVGVWRAFHSGFASHVSLLPFQRGVLFRHGHPTCELGPGRHRVSPASEKIVFIDIRPIDVKSGFRTVRLADDSAAVFAFTASCGIDDVRKVLYSSTMFPNFPAFVTLCISRAILHECRKEQVETGSSEIKDRVTEACRSRLAASGFELKSFQFARLEVLRTGQAGPLNAGVPSLHRL